MFGTESSTKGVHVVADRPISVYTLDREYESTGGYMALPAQSLGSDYIATSYYENTPGAGGSQIGMYSFNLQLRQGLFLSCLKDYKLSLP